MCWKGSAQYLDGRLSLIQKIVLFAMNIDAQNVKDGYHTSSSE